MDCFENEFEGKSVLDESVDFEKFLKVRCGVHKEVGLAEFLESLISSIEMEMRGRSNYTGGRPKKTHAIEQLIIDLVATFETGNKPNDKLSGCYFDPIENEYKGDLFNFIHLTISSYDARFPLTNNSLGKLIVRTLNEHWR